MTDGVDRVDAGCPRLGHIEGKNVLRREPHAQVRHPQSPLHLLQLEEALGEGHEVSGLGDPIGAAFQMAAAGMAVSGDRVIAAKQRQVEIDVAFTLDGEDPPIERVERGWRGDHAFRFDAQLGQCRRAPGLGNLLAENGPAEIGC